MNGVFRRIVDPLLGMLKQGMEPKRLALCVAIGMVMGNIPILGVSSILCALIALVFRLNLPAMQVVQWAMAPTQLLLIIPFVRLGEWLLRAPHQPLSIQSGMALMAQGVFNAVVVLWGAIVHAGFAWLLVAPVVTYLLYALLTPVFERAAAKIGRQRNANDPAGTTAAATNADASARNSGRASITPVLPTPAPPANSDSSSSSASSR